MAAAIAQVGERVLLTALEGDTPNLARPLLRTNEINEPSVGRGTVRLARGTLRERLGISTRGGNPPQAVLLPEGEGILNLVEIGE